MRSIINWKLTASLALCLLIGISWAMAAGTLTLPANPVYNVLSNGGVPTSGVLNGNGGFTPSNMGTGTFASLGCLIEAAGGNMGNLSYTGANFLMACDIEDTTGRFFLIWNNDNSNLPHTIFEVRRNGYTYANGISIQQTGDYNLPYYTANQFAFSGGTGWGSLNVTSDVSSSTYPVIAAFGLNPVQGTGRPPLVSTFGNSHFSLTSFARAGQLNTQVEDDGSVFTSQLTRTTAAYTNATTTLGIISTPTGSGALLAPALSGRTYDIHGKLYITTATGGVKIALNSSTTVSALRLDVRCTDYATSAVLTPTFVTALATAAGATSTSFTSGGICEVDGTATMSAGGQTIIAMNCADASAVCTTTSTTGVVANQLVTQSGTACDAIAANSYVVSLAANTSVTLSRNATCEPASINYRFLDSIWLEAASNAAGTLTLAQGSSLTVTGSLNGGTY